MKKRTVSILLAAMLALSMTACENSKDQEAQTNATTQESEEADTQETTDTPAEETNQNDTSAQGGSNMLVAYFTYAENADLPDGVDASSSAMDAQNDGNEWLAGLGYVQ